MRPDTGIDNNLVVFSPGKGLPQTTDVLSDRAAKGALRPDL